MFFAQPLPRVSKMLKCQVSKRTCKLYLSMRVRFANFIYFSGLDFGKPLKDSPTLVHIAPSNETNVFDPVASSLLQRSML